MDLYGPYISFCVLMDSTESLWPLIGPYSSIRVSNGSLWVLIVPYASLWILMCLYVSL